MQSVGFSKRSATADAVEQKILGNTIGGTQAGHVRIPYADRSLYAVPSDADAEAGLDTLRLYIQAR